MSVMCSPEQDCTSHMAAKFWIYCILLRLLEGKQEYFCSGSLLQVLKFWICVCRGGEGRVNKCDADEMEDGRFSDVLDVGFEGKGGPQDDAKENDHVTISIDYWV